MKTSRSRGRRRRRTISRHDEQEEEDKQEEAEKQLQQDKDEQEQEQEEDNEEQYRTSWWTNRSMIWRMTMRRRSVLNVLTELDHFPLLLASQLNYLLPRPFVSMFIK
ncbi:Hypothetical predicted protein [Mytilus galloprovincialis]|uniref:Uncharacterized protein n=1 Tax=Mytilus galloprovincialis TaxID=29158 RepID=A0A8B6HB30_MYTGA|nr:Hypothetical predicted protein [Mytilus galloprovincialis]